MEVVCVFVGWDVFDVGVVVLVDYFDVICVGYVY